MKKFLLALLSLAVINCEPSSEFEFGSIGVSGFYKISEGTLTNLESETEIELAGYYFFVNQKHDAVHVLDCLAILDNNEIKCDNLFYDWNDWGERIYTHVKGNVKFENDGIEMKIEHNGFNIEYEDYGWLYEYDLKAERVSLDELEQ